MAQLRLTLEGKVGEISLKSLATAVSSSLRILSVLDAAMSEDNQGELTWVVSGLHEGSLVIEVESRSLVEERDLGPEVARAFLDGLRRIERDGASPPYLSERGLVSARRLVKLVGSDGTLGLKVSDLHETVVITTHAGANVDQLARIRHRAIGSIEGRLDVISVHGRTPRFIVYLSSTCKAVTCQLDPAQLDAAKAALGRRVYVAGVVLSNARGEPVRVEAEQIRVLRSADQLPTIAELTGSDPAFTGGAGATAYLRGMRGA